jgi:hypothetical protein
MRLFLSAAIASATVLASAAEAQSAIQLDPLHGQSKPSMETVHDYCGACGPAVVQVLGVLYEEETDHFYVTDLPAANVIVNARGIPPRSLELKNALSDHNGVACLPKDGTHYSLVWSRCGGTACGDDFDFTVVDVEKLKIVAGGGGENSCDERYAATITGSSLPRRLNHL